MTIFRKTVLSAEKKYIFIGRGKENDLFCFAFALDFNIRHSCLDMAGLENIPHEFLRKSENCNDRIWLVERRGCEKNRQQTVLQRISSEKISGGVYGVCV